VITPWWQTTKMELTYQNQELNTLFGGPKDKMATKGQRVLKVMASFCHMKITNKNALPVGKAFYYIAIYLMQIIRSKRIALGNVTCFIAFFKPIHPLGRGTMRKAFRVGIPLGLLLQTVVTNGIGSI